MKIGTCIKKNREYPINGGGSLTLAQHIDNEDVSELKNKVLNILQEEGYCGQYDIEFLVCDEGVYLNEINFRQSGNAYGLIDYGIKLPYITCLDMAGINVPKELYKEVPIGQYHMDEIGDFIQVRKGNVNILTWLNDLRKTHSFAIFNFDDLPGTYGFYKLWLLGIIKRLKQKIKFIFLHFETIKTHKTNC